MTREKKFRAWDGEKMYLPCVELQYGIWCSEVYQLYKDGLGVVPEGSILMQYTGLKDANGVEVYEGDIVAFESLMEGHHKAVALLRCVDDLDLSGRNSKWNKLTVIGNIHANPNLIGETV